MAEVTVRIDDVETYHGISKKTDKEYTKFSVKAGGKKYVTFKREIVEPAGALKNQLAVLTYSEDDYGYTLERVSAATGATESPLQPTLDTQPRLDGVGRKTSPESSHYDEYGDSRSAPRSVPTKDLQIARAVALKAAVETATGLQLAEADSDAILRIANVYVSWLLNGESNPFADLQEAPVNTDEPVELTQGGALLAGAGL